MVPTRRMLRLLGIENYTSGGLIQVYGAGEMGGWMSVADAVELVGRPQGFAPTERVSRLRDAGEWPIGWL